MANNKNPNQKSLRWFWSLTVNGRAGGSGTLEEAKAQFQKSWTRGQRQACLMSYVMMFYSVSSVACMDKMSDSALSKSE